MQIKHIYHNELIKKAIKKYSYDKIISQESTNEDFYDNYSFYFHKKNLNDLKLNSDLIYGGLIPMTSNCHIAAAKSLIFKENNLCWKFFERSALFYVYSNLCNDISFVDLTAHILNLALYVERFDLIDILLSKINIDLDSSINEMDKNIIKQEIYPSTYLIHFLLEKLGIFNPSKEKIFKLGKGVGIYEKIISEWDTSFSVMEESYWNSLCEYHLEGIGVTGTSRKAEEFLFLGLVPMELINLFKVRKKLGMDIPEISHELFKTPMATYPKIPTGYNQELDVKFQLFDITKKSINLGNLKQYTFNDVIAMLKEKHGENANLFY